MAKMTIDIINPKIDLIKGLSENTNSCLSIFEFDIQSTPNATIKVFLERINNDPEDYKYAQIDTGNGFSSYTSGKSVTLTTGTARFRLVIGNAFRMNLKKDAELISNSDGEICAMTKVSVGDITNAVSEETILTRCNSSAPCSGLPTPTANDDEFTVEEAEVKLLDVLNNDDANSTLTSLSISINSQPQEGSIQIVDGQIEYTHTGSTNTTDTFTYKVVNDEGTESNIATVTVNIPFVGDTSSIPFYTLTEHYAGESGKSANRYSVGTVSGYTPPDGKLLERKKADGTIRETGFAENVYITPAFLEGDTVASTIPLDKLRTLSARYHNIKQLLFTPSIDAPNLEYLKLRGNWSNLGTLNLTNNRKLYYIDISMNYIDDILLPTTDETDTDNNFTFAYLGHYQNDAPAPRSVVNKLMRRAYYSNVSDATQSAVETKRFNSQTSVGTLYYDGVNYHKLLIDKGWSIEHISTEEAISFPTEVEVPMTTENAYNVSGVTLSNDGSVSGSGSFDYGVDIPIDTELRLKETFVKAHSHDYASGAIVFKYPDGYEKARITIDAANAAGDLFVDGVKVNDNYTTYANYRDKEYSMKLMSGGKILGNYIADQPVTITREKSNTKFIDFSGVQYGNNYPFVGNATLDFMTSHHNWDLVIPSEASWLTADKGSGQASNEVQTITFTATENTTGAQRSTPVYLRKIKEYPRTTSRPEEDGTEFHYKATITVTQE